jgi:hypothetical protein
MAIIISIAFIVPMLFGTTAFSMTISFNSNQQKGGQNDTAVDLMCKEIDELRAKMSQIEAKGNAKIHAGIKVNNFDNDIWQKP